MIYMLAGVPMWLCSICYGPVKRGQVLYGVEGMRGHFPAAHICCSESCAIICEDRLPAKPVKRMEWQAFLEALTQ